MSAFSKGILTKKHPSHDDMWLLQNSNLSVICFACAVETLEDETTLNIRKRKMVSEILDLLTTNRLIWEIFLKHKTTLHHTGKVLLQLLSTKDKQLSSLLVETIGAFAQRVRDENAVSFLDLLVNAIRNAKDNTTGKIYPYVCLLGKILRSSNTIVKSLLMNSQWVLGIIADGIDLVEEKEAVSYWYVFTQVYRIGSDTDIGKETSKLLLEKIVNAVGNAVSKELQLNILAVLKNFATRSDLRDLIFEQEEQDAVLSRKSLADALKKLILSPIKSVQLCAAQCLGEMLNDSPQIKNDKIANFASLMIDKGLCEFLFELLESSEPLLVASVFDCLLKFSNCPKFFAGGHIIYGFESIVQALLRMLEKSDRSLMKPGLGLLHRILEEDTNRLGTVVKDLNVILKILVNISETHETSILDMGIICSETLIRRVPKDLIDTSIVKLLLENFCKAVLQKATKESSKTTVDPKVMCLLFNTLNFAICICRVLQESTEASEEGKMGFDEEYMLSLQCHLGNMADLYLIPATVILIPFIKVSKIFASFFHLLSLLLEDVNGAVFAKKLCEASFIRMASEIKCRLLAEQNNEFSISYIHQFLVKLANKLDGPNKQISLGAIMEKTLPFLNPPPREWYLYFGRSSSNADVNIVLPVRTACISLLYLSTRFADKPIWKPETIIKSISNCLLTDCSFEDDVTYRNLFYLWSYAKAKFQNEDQDIHEGEKRLLSILERMIEVNDMFISEKCFIIWVLTASDSKKVKQWVLTEVFSSLIPNSGGSTNINLSRILDTLSSFAANAEFYVTCTNIVTYQRGDIVAHAVKVMSHMIQNGSEVDFVPSLKDAIAKQIFSNGSDLDHVNVTALLTIYSNLLTREIDKIHDGDLKFSSMVCRLFIENPYPQIRIGVLNFLNQFLSLIGKHGCSFQAAVICKEIFMKEIVSLLPRSFKFAGESFEKLASASLVLISQLVMLISSQNIETIPIQTIELNKELLLSGVTCKESQLLQNACLLFWSNFLSTNKSEIGFLKHNGLPFKLNNDEMRTLLAYSQNLIFFEESLTKEIGSRCLLSIMSLLRTTLPEFRSPWNIFILDHCIKNLANASEKEFCIQLLQQLLDQGIQPQNRKTLISSIMKILNHHPLGGQAYEIALMKIVFFLVDQNCLSDEEKECVNCYLHRLEDCLNGFIASKSLGMKNENHTHCIVNGVIFPLRNEDGLSLKTFSPGIVKYREKVTKRDN